MRIIAITAGARLGPITAALANETIIQPTMNALARIEAIVEPFFEMRREIGAHGNYGAEVIYQYHTEVKLPRRELRARNGYAPAARLPCYRGARTR